MNLTISSTYSRIHINNMKFRFQSILITIISFVFAFLVFHYISEAKASVNYGSGFYTNLCGGGADVNGNIGGYNCEASCNTGSGVCEAPAGGHVDRYVCNGKITNCDNTNAPGNVVSFSTGGSKSLTESVSCGQTVQLDAFDGGNSLKGFMTWYSGDCAATNQAPVTTCRNETKSWDQLLFELRAMNYPGPWDRDSSIAAYNRAACPQTTTTKTQLSEPTGLNAACVAGTSNVNLTWNSVSNATHYIVRINRIDGTAPDWNPGNFGDLSGTGDRAALVNGTSLNVGIDQTKGYHFTVTADNTDQTKYSASTTANGPEFQCQAPVQKIQLSPATNLNAACVAGSSTVNLSWSPVQNASHYVLRVNRIDGAAPDWNPAQAHGDLSGTADRTATINGTTVNGLTVDLNKPYEFTIVADNTDQTKYTASTTAHSPQFMCTSAQGNPGTVTACGKTGVLAPGYTLYTPATCSAGQYLYVNVEGGYLTNACLAVPAGSTKTTDGCSYTANPINTPTPTQSGPTHTPTPTVTPTGTLTPTLTPTVTPTGTLTPTVTPTGTLTPTLTPTLTLTPTPLITGVTVNCPQGSVQTISGSTVICININQSQTQTANGGNGGNATVNITGTVAGTTQIAGVKELPKTGLPLAAWAFTGLIPAGVGFKKFGGKKIEDLTETPTFIWQSREFDKQ